MHLRSLAPPSSCAALLLMVPFSAAQAPPVAAPAPAASGAVIAAEPTGPPARPASRVLDQTGALTAPERAALSRDFTDSAAAGLSLYFIALNSSEGLTEEDAASDLARLWEDAPLTAVILHVPGRAMSLGFSGSRLASLQQDEIDSLSTSALTAGRARQTMPEQGKAAARRLIEDFTRYRAGEPLTPYAGAFATRSDNNSTHHLILWAGSAVIVFLSCLLFLARRRRAHRPRLFPLTAPRERFSAPHSGGNNVMIAFSNERGEE